MSVMIRTEGLRKVYRVGEEKVVALAGIDLAIEKGEICCIIGASGSGKSTLLNMLAGLEKPDAGAVFFDEVNITGFTPADRDVAFVFQQYSLYPTRTVYQNLNAKLAMERQQTEVGALFSGIAALFGLFAALLSVWWFYRVVPTRPQTPRS